ncbi:unnamed protein product, partial [Citrullus colocynthis]
FGGRAQFRCPTSVLSLTLLVNSYTIWSTLKWMMARKLMLLLEKKTEWMMAKKLLLAQQNETKTKKKRKRGPTIIFDVTHVRSAGERKLVEYNDDGVPIGENGAKLNSFIGSCAHYHIPITYATWKRVHAKLKDKIYNIGEAAFTIDSRSRKVILRIAGKKKHPARAST